MSNVVVSCPSVCAQVLGVPLSGVRQQRSPAVAGGDLRESPTISCARRQKNKYGLDRGAKNPADDHGDGCFAVIEDQPLA